MRASDRGPAGIQEGNVELSRGDAGKEDGGVGEA
jgi:hypothetical protein